MTSSENSIGTQDALEDVRTQANLLTRLIRQDIVEANLLPGSKLKVRELADRYQVGASPVREALSRLLTTSLVVTEDRRGFRVASASIHEFERLTWTRVGVETLALREAIGRGSKQWEAQLMGAHHLLESAIRPTQLDSEEYRLWDIAHYDFHKQLLEPCDAPWLFELTDSLYHHCSRYRWLAMRASPNSLQRVAADEHEAILRACLRRDANTATELLSAHYQKTFTLCQKALEKH